ncbi:O-Antigen ligase [bacterium BMS3Bbin10]|nr:O-Antigen ligase [bacterium BMS3Bbin10]
MNLIKLRAEIMLLVVAAYLILNQGAMMVRIPPAAGSGLPVGEALVILFGLTLALETRRLPSFAAVAPVAALLVWWGLAVTQLIIGLPKYGFWAVRDASHAIESSFLWIGFVVAAAPGFLGRFSSWLRVVLNVGAFYALLYPFRETLTGLSPKLDAAAGYTVPLFFNFISAGLVPLTAAVRWLVDRSSLFGIPAVFLAGAMIVYCAVIFQMRTTYLQIMAVFIVMIAIQPRIAFKMSLGMLFGLAGLSLVLASGIEITGRLGEKFSLDFFFQHFAAIWGVQGDGMVRDAALGVSQRLRWWADIWRQLSADVQTLLFGLGYGMPLTDFYFTGDIRVREPHNSIISIVARVGFAGLFFFILFHLALLRVWVKAYRWCVKNGETLWRNNLLIIGVYFLLMWIYSIGEDAFEKPYNAITYYFLWGVVLRVYYEILAPQGRLRRKHEAARAAAGRAAL